MTAARAARKPLVLVSPNIEKKGDEFGDLSISLSETYQEALLGAGAVPLALANTVSEAVIAESVARCDGVLLTGGEDLDPGIYATDAPAKLKALVTITPDGGKRDLRELLLVREVFRQRKPLLAICRGHQVLNVALGGTLHLDIPTQIPGAIGHRQMERRSEVVHEVTLTPGSLVAKITGKQSLGVNSTHHQAVARVAPCLQAVGKSADGVVEVLEMGPREAAGPAFLLSVQFHPERLVAEHPEHRAIFHAFVQACAGYL
jgi:putative glutamine amidotransferase